MASHPAASHGIFLPGVEGLELRQLGQGAAVVFMLGARGRAWSQGRVLLTVLAVLEAHRSIGLELAGHFRVFLWDVCLLIPQFNMPVLPH